MPSFFRSDGWVKAVTGQAVPGAQIYVCTQPANVAFAPPTPLVSIYSDPNGLVPITQPILTDGFGHYDFYVLPGTYTVVVTLAGIIQQVYPDQSIGVAGGGGTVTSVGLTADPGSILAVSGSPITGTGTFGLSFNTVAANLALMGPTSGPAAVPTFRQPAFADLSSNISVNQMNSGTGASSSTFWRGDGSWASAGASFSTAGQGGFFGPGNTGYNGWGFNSAVNIVATNNEVRTTQFILPYTILISRITVRVQGNAGGNKCWFGIYSSDGNTKLVDSGTFSVLTNPSTLTNTITPVTLSPGTYIFAQSANDNTNLTVTGFNTSSTAIAMYNVNGTRMGIAANGTGGTALPATLGTITAATTASTGASTWCAAPFFEP